MASMPQKLYVKWYQGSKASHTYMNLLLLDIVSYLDKMFTSQTSGRSLKKTPVAFSLTSTMGARFYVNNCLEKVKLFDRTFNGR